MHKTKKTICKYLHIIHGRRQKLGDFGGILQCRDLQRERWSNIYSANVEASVINQQHILAHFLNHFYNNLFYERASPLAYQPVAERGWSTSQPTTHWQTDPAPPFFCWAHSKSGGPALFVIPNKRKQLENVTIALIFWRETSHQQHRVCLFQITFYYSWKYKGENATFSCSFQVLANPFLSTYCSQNYFLQMIFPLLIPMLKGWKLAFTWKLNSITYNYPLPPHFTYYFFLFLI